MKYLFFLYKSKYLYSYTKYISEYLYLYIRVKYTLLITLFSLYISLYKERITNIAIDPDKYLLLFILK